MITIRKVLTISSLFVTLGFAQGSPEPPPQSNDDWGDWSESSDSTATSQPEAAPQEATTDTVAAAPNDSTQAAPADSANVATADSTVDSTAAPAEEPAEQQPAKPRNKITYADYQAKVKASAKKRSRTLHHGLSVVDANYQDKRYGHMDHDANWGAGMGLYYFYRRYFGHYLGFQGRVGGIYRYSRWTFEEGETSGALSDGAKYTLTHEINRKYHNFAADIPLSVKLGHHIKKTTGFIYTSLTLALTKPIFEMVDTENRLYLNSNSSELNNDLEVLSAQGENPFPLYESHQTHKFFYMDDWETSAWIGVGVESRLVSVEFQVYGIGASTSDNHRYHHLGHDSNFTWRLFLDFSIK